MTLVAILLGLLGLGLVVFVHELGHFLMARLFKVEVEEFSIGWGPKLIGIRRGKTLYRLSVLPIGGFCKMKGEDSYRKAIEDKLEDFPREPGTYFAAHPLQRIGIALGGPIFNLLFAFIVFMMVMAIGYKVQTFDNRIILAEDFGSAAGLPAKTAGLLSGDRIMAIDGKPLSTFSEIQERIAAAPQTPLALTVERAGTTRQITVVPLLDTESGAGKIGIYPWIEPKIGKVAPEGAGYIAGLLPGDTIRSVDGQPVRHSLDLSVYLSNNTPSRVALQIQRDNSELEILLVPTYSGAAVSLGIEWQTEELLIRSATPLQALKDGFVETIDTVRLTLHGIGTLFKGVNPLKALSGPARITWIVGQVTTDSFGSGLQQGFTSSFNFLAILSIGLFIMNLLPIPVLDGGWILLFLVELVKRTPVRVKTVFRYQMIGLFAILALFLLTTVGDILFFSGK